MKNDHGVDAFYFHDKLGQVLRDLGSYKADELARALCRLAKVADENVLKEPEFAQQPATAVPDGWKLVPVEPDPEMTRAIAVNTIGNASIHALKCAYSSYRAMLAAAPAAPADADDECVHEFVPFQAGCTKCGEPYAAAPAAPVAQEPVAYLIRNPRTGKVRYYGAPKRYLAEQWALGGYEVTPLYAAPPAAEPPGTVKALREKLETVTELLELLGETGATYQYLRALLGKEGE